MKSLEDALENDRELVEPYLTRCAEFNDQPFADLNTAFLREGVFLYIPKGTVIAEAIHLLYVTTSNGPQARASGITPVIRLGRRFHGSVGVVHPPISV